MAFNQTNTYGESPSVVESEIGLVTKTATGAQSSATTVGTRKILKAGELVSDDDSNPLGVVLEDIDITDDENRPVAIVVAGRVYKDRCSDAAQAQETAFAANGLFLV